MLRVYFISVVRLDCHLPGPPEDIRFDAVLQNILYCFWIHTCSRFYVLSVTTGHKRLPNSPDIYSGVLLSHSRLHCRLCSLKELFHRLLCTGMLLCDSTIEWPLLFDLACEPWLTCVVPAKIRERNLK